jgi:DNA-binding transcriptional regulator YiaG
MTGSELRRIRKRLVLTQGEMANLVGVALNTVWRWEADRVRIPEPTARLIGILAEQESRRRRRRKK